MALEIMTCVTNGQGMGPGHTALYIDGVVWSFEAIGSRNGWKKFDYSKYVHDNRWRPIIYQSMKVAVDKSKVEAFLHSDSSSAVNLYGANVCSQRASKALEAGASAGFDPPGLDTPYGVYWHAWDKEYVDWEVCIWPDKGVTKPALVWSGIVNKLRDDYQFELKDVRTA